MGAFIIARDSIFAVCGDRLNRAHQQCGLELSRTVSFDGFTLLLYRKLDGEGGIFIKTGDGGFACLTGQLLYCGEAGEAALRRYCVDLAEDRLDCERIIGQFALLRKDAHGLRLSTDPMGFYQVYVDTSTGVASSSFWALLELLPKITVDPQGVYEYAWTGATYGGKTFVKQIRRLPARAMLVANGEMTQVEGKRPSTPAAASDMTLADYVDDHAERLRRLFSELVGAFGDRLRVSFSSGYDSRLILAGLKAVGLRPGLFVYGQDGDAEVEIARGVATGEGLRLDVIDKSRLVDPAAAALATRQEDDFVRFDAWKVDGIFDDGVDACDRSARHADDRIPLNGSLGEIYRNFFYIPDRPLELAQVVESFFSSYAPAAATEQFRVVDYTAGLVQAFQDELGTSETRVSRAQVESLYPLARGRYWTGRDVNLNLRFGRMVFPFLHAQLISGTPEIPIRFKNHGRFEAALITRLDSGVAGYPSGYGYRFTEQPPLKHCARSWLTLFRPPWLRRYSYRLRFARPQAVPSYLEHAHLAQFFDVTMPYMKRYFHAERLHDPAAFNRVATMEYIFQRYDASE